MVKVSSSRTSQQRKRIDPLKSMTAIFYLTENFDLI